MTRSVLIAACAMHLAPAAAPAEPLELFLRHFIVTADFAEDSVWLEPRP